MYKWVIAYPTISRIKNKEWVDKDELIDCFTKLFLSKNIGLVLKSNFPDLHIENGRYIYDEKELADMKVKL